MSEFHRHPKNGFRPRCKTCRKAEWDAIDHTDYQKAYYAEHREKMLSANREYRTTHSAELAAKNKIWREANREVLRSKKLMKTYGITLEQWHEMFAAQGKACLICRSTEPGSVRGWHTDHGVTVRGILCHHCNTGLGSFNHDVSRLKAAIRYLSK